MGYDSAIGDTQEASVQPVVSALPISETTAAALADKDNAINNAMYSGKKIGAMYCYEIASDQVEVVIATGSAATDPWIKLGALVDATALKADWAAGDVGDAAAIATALNTQAAEVNAFITGTTITPS
jgi:hypothetical protein